MRRRNLAAYLAIGLLIVGLQFAARGAQAQQDPLLGLHNCEAYYPKSQWFKKCAPFCYGILYNAGQIYLPPECHEWINGPPRVTRPRHCTQQVVHQYENQITYTQSKIEDLWVEIKSKAIVLGLSLIAFEAEIPFLLGCFVKASHLKEANEL